MTALLLAVAVLAADPSAAEQRLIDKTRAELKAARVKAGGPLLAKIEAAKADLEAIEAGEIDPKLRQTFTRKTVKGKPVYVFRHETYRVKERERANDIIHNANQTTDSACTPPLNLMNLRKGAKGKLATTVNDLYSGDIKENEPDENGANLVIRLNSFSNEFPAVDVRVRVTGATPVISNRLSCVVTGVKKVHGHPVYQLLVVEQFDSSGNLIEN